MKLNKFKFFDSKKNTISEPDWLIDIIDKFERKNIIEGDRFIQYLGIKDSKGNEIYEGDILLLILKEGSFIGEVYFNDIRDWGIRNGNMNFNTYWHFHSTTIKIIGNIFQDKEQYLN